MAGTQHQCARMTALCARMTRFLCARMTRLQCAQMTRFQCAQMTRLPYELLWKCWDGLFLFQPSPRHQSRRVTWMSALAGGRSGGLTNMVTILLYTNYGNSWEWKNHPN